jgi:hypothetical protein
MVDVNGEVSVYPSGAPQFILVFYGVNGAHFVELDVFSILVPFL